MRRLFEVLFGWWCCEFNTVDVVSPIIVQNNLLYFVVRPVGVEYSSTIVGQNIISERIKQAPDSLLLKHGQKEIRQIASFSFPHADSYDSHIPIMYCYRLVISIC